jgi:CarboxypepD_reg-like domain
MAMKILLAVMFVLSVSSITIPSMAQVKHVFINGKVSSFEESLPLEGASIRVKNSNNGTDTQADGSFSLSIAPAEKILVVSLHGYETKEITITNARQYDIVLKQAAGLAPQPRQMHLSGPAGATLTGIR